MNTPGDFDANVKRFGYVLTGLMVFAFVILAAKPWSMVAMKQVAALLTLVALFITLHTLKKAVDLYGRRSSEGKLWYRLIIMMVVLAVGLALSEFISDELHIFAVSAIIGFWIAMYAMMDRIRDSGMKVGRKAVFYASMTVACVLLFISILMTVVAEHGLQEMDPGEYWVEFIVLFVAIFSTFLGVLMGSVMGGHISRGWYYVAMGAATFSVTYTLIVVTRAIGIYDDILFIESFQILALNLVSFSAYYQRRKHLAMIAEFM